MKTCEVNCNMGPGPDMIESAEFGNWITERGVIVFAVVRFLDTEDFVIVPAHSVSELHDSDPDLIPIEKAVQKP